MNHKLSAILEAKDWIETNPIFLDTETTGLDDRAEICDLAIVALDGSVLMNTLVRPSIPIPDAATYIHGISNWDVREAPTYDRIHDDLLAITRRRELGIYNAAYDIGILKQSAWARNLDILLHNSFCVMKLYAEFYGEFDGRRGNYRWQKLGVAAYQCGIKPTGELHHALQDADMARRILIHMANVEV